MSVQFVTLTAKYDPVPESWSVPTTQTDCVQNYHSLVTPYLPTSQRCTPFRSGPMGDSYEERKIDTVENWSRRHLGKSLSRAARASRQGSKPVPKIQKDYGSEAIGDCRNRNCRPRAPLIAASCAYRRKEPHGAALSLIYSSATERPPSGGLFVGRYLIILHCNLFRSRRIKSEPGRAIAHADHSPAACNCCFKFCAWLRCTGPDFRAAEGT